MLDVVVDHVSFAYGKKLVLSDIAMEVEAGSFVCILGQSGSGKSTLLRLLAGLEKPSSGRILCQGEEISGTSLERGMVFQNYGLFPWKTAGRNIELGLRQKYKKSWSKAQLKQRALEMLDAVGLDRSVYNMLPKELSGGMQQRCAIARSFGIDSRILLMDEPFGALDAITRAKLQELVLGLWARETPHKTIFFVTHDVDEALLLATKIFVIGQVPSKVIFSCDIPEEHRMSGDRQLDDEWMVDLRNELVRRIRLDISGSVRETA